MSEHLSELEMILATTSVFSEFARQKNKDGPIVTDRAASRPRGEHLSEMTGPRSGPGVNT